MVTITASRRDAPVTVLATTVAFGLLLGWATYGLHGATPLLERATNSVSTWIIWTAVAGALIRARQLAVWGGALMMLATCGGYYAASALGDTFGAGGLGTAAAPAPEGGSGLLLLVGEDLAAGEVGVIVDGVVQVAVTHAGAGLAAGLAAQGLVAAAVGDVAELLDVHVHQLARRGAFVAADHPSGGAVEMSEMGRLVAGQDSVHRARVQAQQVGDAGRSPKSGRLWHAR